MGRDSAVLDPSREFAYTLADFERVRSMIHRHAGIALADSKRDLVYSRLARRLRALDIETFRRYLDQLEQAPESDEWEHFTNALTTNLTSFFREAHHFDILRDQLRSLPPGKRILIWCCAASTGEEPYSIAMTACEAFGRLDPPVSILATDIATDVLDTAQRGVYAMERVESLSKERLKKFFLRGGGSNEGQVKVVDALKRLVTFRQLNLLEPHWGLKGPFSALFCRNIMIYFDKPTQAEILQRFVPLIADGGHLYMGHSETLSNPPGNIQSIGRTTYRKRSVVRS
ncbi:CheR family methyltransferase [Sinimarinibacterium sp. NLF-5-8]|uniref:CheR family methyltransferase n=1 Tax=Sinimarinibacterium sp. NLF-5-8 TaxID=2698684 RepID=UPI00137BF3DF|nr:CheR family methyltransferase [Sinimarinibacterium sp. NLF-5-8]QHS08723.1 chemotaxis protein CheR [Sinimarinibacterium sp. NLF-5-8]